MIPISPKTEIRASGRSMMMRVAALMISVTALSACNTLQRLSEVGQEPRTSRIDNPVMANNYQPVSMPMPAPLPPSTSANSLWRPGARAFFKDQRASRIGDILTVAVDYADEKADFNATSETSRDANERTDTVFNLLGFAGQLGKILPDAVDPTALGNFGSDSYLKGEGNTTRTDTMKANIAAVITQILPNGNLVIQGRQEYRVNYEMRELTVRGVIRPEDITVDNTIPSEKIAEARITYGGRGNVSDMTHMRWGQEIYEILFPF